MCIWTAVAAGGYLVHFPFLVEDHFSKVQTRLTAERLAELSLAPQSGPWDLLKGIEAYPDPVWAKSFESAPAETCAAVSSALLNLLLATSDLNPPSVDGLPDGRAKQRLSALINLWATLGDQLPEGLATVRHVMKLPHGHFLRALPVVEGSLDPNAPKLFTSLFERLKAEFGAVPSQRVILRAPAPSALHNVQGGLTEKDLVKCARDDSMQFYGLRDVAACAEFAAAQARTWMEGGVAPSEIAVLSAGDTYHLKRAFAAQNIPISGLPAAPAKRDIVGETALHLLLAKRAPAPSMALASLALSSLMPWDQQTGRRMAELIVAGKSANYVLEPIEEHIQLWRDIRQPAPSLAALQMSIIKICGALKSGDDIKARILATITGEELDWDVVLRSFSVNAPTTGEAQRYVEGVSLWAANESPWRSCQYLIVSDFCDGAYPSKPRANSMFLDSEIETLNAATKLGLSGRSADLARSLALFQEQLQNVGTKAVFLIPYRNMGGDRIMPSMGLSLLARAYEGVDKAQKLIEDISSLDPTEWPVSHHVAEQIPEGLVLPEFIDLAGVDLLSLRKDREGGVKPQSPTALEKLLISPVAWLLGEIGADDKQWASETLDARVKGIIFHNVFEGLFPPGNLPDVETVKARHTEVFEKAVSKEAAFMKEESWRLEYDSLKTEVLGAALRWLEQMSQMGAKVLANETWLNGTGHGIALGGKTDTILELPDSSILIVDHKSGGSKKRAVSMERGWDLQVSLYREMLSNPARKDGDKLDPLVGRPMSIAYNMIKDSTVLTSGREWDAGVDVKDMGSDVSVQCTVKLGERIAELRRGQIHLNTSTDAKNFERETGSKTYELDGKLPLVTALVRSVEGE